MGWGWDLAVPALSLTEKAWSVAASVHIRARAPPRTFWFLGEIRTLLDVHCDR